jgi:hypothetical protein
MAADIFFGGNVALVHIIHYPKDQSGFPQCGGRAAEH